MRAISLGAIMGMATIVACFVDRPSEALECSSQADCDTRFPDDNRQCTAGYCVVPNCPADCTSCDEAANICNVDCTNADKCLGTIDCPGGWTCRINCDGTGACSDITCASGSECDVVCTGAGACGDVQCSAACRCDLTCAAGACDSSSCPTVGNGNNQVRCTEDGTADAACDSARDSGCTKC